MNSDALNETSKTETDVQIMVAKIGRNSTVLTSVISAVVVIVTTMLGIQNSVSKQAANTAVTAAHTAAPAPDTVSAGTPPASASSPLYSNDWFSVYYVSGMAIDISDCTYTETNGQWLVSLTYRYVTPIPATGSKAADVRADDSFTEVDLMHFVKSLQIQGADFTAGEEHTAVFPLSGEDGVYVPIVMCNKDYDYVGNTILHVVVKR